jgi:hypothetical protein
MNDRYDREKVLAAIEHRAAKLSPEHRDAFMAQLVKDLMTGDLYRPARDPETVEQARRLMDQAKAHVDETLADSERKGAAEFRARVLEVLRKHDDYYRERHVDLVVTANVALDRLRRDLEVLS